MKIEQRYLDAAVPYAGQPYAIVVEPDEAGGKLCYIAFHPEMETCIGQGDTPAAAIEDLAEARLLTIAALIEFGQPIPEPRFKLHSKAA